MLYLPESIIGTNKQYQLRKYLLVLKAQINILFYAKFYLDIDSYCCGISDPTAERTFF